MGYCNVSPTGYSSNSCSQNSSVSEQWTKADRSGQVDLASGQWTKVDESGQWTREWTSGQMTLIRNDSSSQMTLIRK